MTTYRDLSDEVATLRQELASLRPVVEAAKAWRKGHGLIAFNEHEAETHRHWRRQDEVDLAAAVDAFVVSAPPISADEGTSPQPFDLHKLLAEEMKNPEFAAAWARSAEPDPLREAATRVVQLVDQAASDMAVGAAIADLRRALDGAGR